MTLLLPNPISAARSNRLLTALLAAALAALLCGLFVHANGYVWLAAAAAILGIGLAWPWVVIRATTARLRFDSERGREGEPASATLDVRCRLPWKPIGLRLDGDAALAGEVEVGRRALDWTPKRFGPVGKGLVLSFSRPFGLWTATKQIELSREMLIWPATHKAGPVPDCEGRDSGEHAGRRVGTGGEFCGVRDFRAGDRLRLVHWAQSAKHERLVVRETLADATPQVCVGLSLNTKNHPDADAFDAAVRHAASMVEGWTRSGSTVVLAVDDRRISCPPNAKPRIALDALALLSANDLTNEAAMPANVDVWARDERRPT
ncbi:MAG: DUF58 domain-containing protein [Planctomycetota bacterium]